MKDTLVSLNQSVSGIQASAIFTVDGVLLASTLAYDEDPDEVGAIVAAMHSMGGKTAGLLRRGGLQRIQVQGDKGTMIVSALDEAALLIILTQNQANIGLVLHEVQRVQKHAESEGWFVDDEVQE